MANKVAVGVSPDHPKLEGGHAMSLERELNGTLGLEAPETGRGAWWAVGILVLLYTISMLDRQLITLMVDLVRQDLQLSDFEISLLVGPAFVITFTIAGLPLGYAADHLQRRYIIAGGVIAWSLATMTCGLSRSFAQLFVARLGVGVGEAALVPASHSMISDYFPPERRTFPLSVFQVGGMLGNGLSLALGGLVVAISLAHPDIAAGLGLRPWQFAFVLIGIPSLGAAFLIFLVREPAREGRGGHRSARHDPGEVTRFIRSHWRFFLAHFLGFSLLVTLTGASAAWSPTVLHRIHGWSIPAAGSALGALSIVSGIIGGLGIGAVVERLYRKGIRDAHLRFQAWACIVVATCGVAAYLAPTAPLFFVALFAAKSFGLVPLIALAPASLQLIAPSHLRGQLTALYMLFVGVLGTGLGPVLVGALTDFGFGQDQRVGWSLAVLFATIAPVSGFLLWSGMGEMRAMVAGKRTVPSQ